MPRLGDASRRREQAVKNIEQRRRDFKVAEPDLYAYITAHEGARILDSAGDTL